MNKPEIWIVTLFIMGGPYQSTAFCLSATQATDFGVVLGLGWGTGSVLYFAGRGLAGQWPEAQTEIPTVPALTRTPPVRSSKDLHPFVAMASTLIDEGEVKVCFHRGTKRKQKAAV